MSKEETKIKEIQNVLLENPSYSSDWIAKASKIMAEFNKTEEGLKWYNSEQLDVIYNAFKQITNNENDEDKMIKNIINPKLNATQMSLMVNGYLKNIPIDILLKFVNQDIPYAKSNYLVQAYIDGFDMSDYIEYDHDQIYEIYAGFVNKVDFKLYDKKCIPSKTMGLIRHALEIGASEISYNQYTKIFSVKV